MDSEQQVFWIEDCDVRMITLWVLEQYSAVILTTPTCYITLVADAQQVLMKANLGQLVLLIVL